MLIQKLKQGLKMRYLDSLLSCGLLTMFLNAFEFIFNTNIIFIASILGASTCIIYSLTKTSTVNFASENFRNIAHESVQFSPTPSKAVKNCCIRPSVLQSRGRRIFSMHTRALYLTFWMPDCSTDFFSPQAFLYLSYPTRSKSKAVYRFNFQSE